MINDYDDYFPDIVDIVEDADAPPGRSEIGYQHEVDDHDDSLLGKQTEIGMDGISGTQDEIGQDGISGEQTEIGQDRYTQVDGISGTQEEIGLLTGIGGAFAMGPDTLTPWDAFMLEPAHLGNTEIGQDGISGEQTEIGQDGISGTQDEIGQDGISGEQTEIGKFAVGQGKPRNYEGIGHGGGGGGGGGHGGGHGGHGHGGRRGGGGWGGGWWDGPWYDGYEIDELEPEEAAVLTVVKTARDSRMPAPRMVAVSPVTPLRADPDEWALTDTVLGVGAATGVDAFPLTTQLLQRFGAGGATRTVRVDTEESYQEFREASSPDLAALREKIEALSHRLDEHEADPEAHEKALFFESGTDDLEVVGASVAEAEAQKRVDLWVPPRFRQHVKAWREGDFVCASLSLPGHDGELRICTSVEPVVKCVEEINRYAAESGVPASTVVGVLPAMGCVLGAGTILKEMAAAAPAILSRPEAKTASPFVVRIEPKASPALCALAALACECKAGNAQACDEWSRLAQVAPPVVKQAMGEALDLAKEVAA